MAPLGRHCLLELHGCPAALLDDVEHVRAAVRLAAERSASALLSELHHRFAPQGVTAVGLLAESHVSVHTWPERGYVAVDVFTCGEHTRPREACLALVPHFGASHHELRELDRGLSPPPRPA